jgi:hypothetical protein
MILKPEQNIERKDIVFALFFMLFSAALYGQEQQEKIEDDSSTVIIRPNGSIGYWSANDIKGLSYSYGLKVLLLANDFQRYGLLIDHINIMADEKYSYLCMGLYIEQVVFKYFNMGIGTVGYVNTINLGKNPFGLYTHLGFEYYFNKCFGVVANYRSEFIFRNSFTMNNAFSLVIGTKL